ncbi:MAG: response regulator, partial [Gammaproteobacteria bacterium]|nr:response regulator [Gammaproteobacteria bacterium]
MKSAAQVWVVDDDRSIRWVLEKALQKASLETRSFTNGNALLDALSFGKPDAILTDIRMPGMDGIELLKNIQAGYPELPVIIMTAHSDLESAVSAFHGGAFEYLPKPFDVDEAVDLVQRAC